MADKNAAARNALALHLQRVDKRIGVLAASIDCLCTTMNELREELQALKKEVHKEDSDYEEES